MPYRVELPSEAEEVKKKNREAADGFKKQLAATNISLPLFFDIQAGWGSLNHDSQDILITEALEGGQ